MAQATYQTLVAPQFQANVTAGALRGAKKAGHRTLFRITASDASSFTKGVSEGLTRTQEISRVFEAEAAARRVALYGS